MLLPFSVCIVDLVKKGKYLENRLYFDFSVDLKNSDPLVISNRYIKISNLTQIKAL